MSREIKFEFLYLGIPYSIENQNRPWIKKQYTLDQLCRKSLAELSDCHSYADLIAKRQFTGLRDVNGVEIYTNDLVNIYFTSSDGEHIHDCIYKAEIGELGDLQFRFVKLLWVDSGHNQYPSSTILCLRYANLDYEYSESGMVKLKIPDSWGENNFHRTRWKQEDKSFYFEVIGNIYEHPHLLDEAK